MKDYKIVDLENNAVIYDGNSYDSCWNSVVQYINDCEEYYFLVDKGKISFFGDY